MSNIISLDFSNVKGFTNLSVGKHILKVKRYEQLTASTGNPMLEITFENAQGETGIDRFVLTDNALWKLQQLFVALFKTNFTGKLNFDLDTMIGKTCTAVAKEEEYVKQDGTPSIRIVLDNYMPVNEADTMGVTPQAPVAPQPQAPVAPVAPAQPVQPVQPQAPVTPVTPVQPQPVYQQPVYQQPAQPVQPAQPTEAPAQPQVAKRPWES